MIRPGGLARDILALLVLGLDWVHDKISCDQLEIRSCWRQPMQPQGEGEVISRAKVWTGRLIMFFTVVFLLFDTLVKVLNLPVAVQGTVRLGYPANLVI